MLPLGSKPIIEHLIKYLIKQGFNDIVLTVGYLNEQVRSYLGDGSRLGAKIHYSIEPEDLLLGTAGSVKLVSHLLNERFVVIQGDAYTDIDLSEVVKAHISGGVDATIVVKSVSNPWLFGTVESDEKGLITCLKEKPRPDECHSSKVSTGIYVLEPETLDFIAQPPCDFAKNVFPKMLASGKKMLAYEGEGYWVDVGSREGYIEAQKHILRKHMEETKSSIWMLGEATVGREAKLEGPVLLDSGVKIDDGALVGPYANILSGSNILSNSAVVLATLFEGVTVGSGSRISESIIGEKAVIGEQVTVEESIIGQAALLKKRVQVKSGCRVWPNVVVDEGEEVKGTVLFTHEKPFYFFSDYGRYTGILASSVTSFLEAVTTVDAKSLEFHLYRRDFERWIRDVIQAPLLAEEVAALRKQMLKGEGLRSELIEVVKAWLKYVTEKSRL
jgi:mannose-1-phosphate guanylyltransferase/phosphomannomutase